MKQNIFGVESVNKALEILNSFTESNEELSLTEISKITGEYKSRISRLSKSLEHYGFIEKKENGKFILGSSVKRLGAIYEKNIHLNDSIQKEIDKISSFSSETASYWIKSYNDRVCVLSSEPKKAIKHTIEIGKLKSLNIGSSGRVLGAFHGLNVKNKDQILKNGYEISFGENDKEIASITVPLFNKERNIFGVLAISGHISNFNKKNTLRFLNILRSSRTSLEKKI